MNNYKSFAELKEELGSNYDFKLYEMGISALKEVEKLQQENKQLNGAVQTYDILLKSNVEENKILKENAENNDKVVDKVNWENLLLKKENKQLKDNWNKLKEFIREEGFEINAREYGSLDVIDKNVILEKMQELEKRK